MGYVIGAAAVAGIASGAMQGESSRKVASQNAEAQRNAQLLDYARYIESRGGDASKIYDTLGGQYLSFKGQQPTILLPGYQPAGTEQQMLKDALAVSDALKIKDPQAELASYRAALDQMNPAIQQGNQYVSDVYNGNLDAQRQAALDPVLRARMEGAKSNQAAIDLALQQSNNAIAADDARKGYVGGSSFMQNRLLGSTLNARQASAANIANANLQNAAAQQALLEAGIENKSKFLNVPVQRAQQLMDLKSAPEAALAARSQQMYTPIMPFKMNPGSPPSVKPVTIVDTPNTGALMMSGLSQGLGSYAQFKQAQGAAAAQQQAGINNYNFNRMAQAGQVPSNYGSLSAADQNAYLNAWSAGQSTPGTWE